MEKINDNEAVQNITTQVVIKLDEQLSNLADIQENINQTTALLAEMQAKKDKILSTIADLEEIGLGGE